jgi:hypothetical protein
MKKGFSLTVGGWIVSALIASNAGAAPASLSLRSESGTCIHGGSTTQTIETSFGSNLVSLPFSGTATYDFYSPPLAAATSVSANDEGTGTIFMSNSGTASADDFIVTGRMAFYDYDLLTGSQTLIVDTGDSGVQTIKHGDKGISWNLAKVPLAHDVTVPVGHLLHISLTVTLISGNPANHGAVLYNGVSGSTTIGILPNKNGSPSTWNFGPPVMLQSVCVNKTSDGCVQLTCTVAPGQNYRIEATTNLAAPVWVSLTTTNAGPNGIFNFIDQDAPNFPARFYRTSSF